MLSRITLHALALAWSANLVVADVRGNIFACSAFQTVCNGSPCVQFNVDLTNIAPQSISSICSTYTKSMSGRGVPVFCGAEQDTREVTLGFQMGGFLLTTPPQAGFVSAMQSFMDTIEGTVEGDPKGSIQCLVQTPSTDINYDQQTRKRNPSVALARSVSRLLVIC
jgi:hypothetical protein